LPRLLAKILPPNIEANIQAAKRNNILGVDAGTVRDVPLIRNRTAPFGQTSAQAPHRLQYILTFLFSTSPRSMAKTGQTFWHSPQETHRSGSVFSSNMLILLVSDWIGPKGQKKAHCVLFLVKKGRITTRAANSAVKITNCTAVLTEVTAGNSVTVLKGHSHWQ